MCGHRRRASDSGKLPGRPAVVLSAGEVILELAPQRLVTLTPAPALAVEFLLRDCLTGEPRVLGGRRADLDVGGTHHLALLLHGRFRGHEGSLAQSDDE